MVMGLFSLSVSHAETRRVALNAETRYLHLGPNMSYLEDTEGSFEMADLISAASDKIWIPFHGETLNFGYTDSVYWVKGDFVNQEPRDLEFLIEIAYPVIDDIQVFIMGKDRVKTLSMGDKKPFYDRPIEHKNFLFPVDFAAYESLTIMFRFKTTSSMQIPLNLYNERVFLEKSQGEMMGLGLYYGSMIIMILYNLFVYLSVREANYLYYVIYVTCMAVFLASLNGTSYHYLWPESIWWNDQVLVVSLCGVVLFAILFTVGFLKVKESRPKSYRVFIFFAVIAGFIILFSYKIPYKMGILSTIGLAVISIVWCMIVTLSRWMEGFSSARFYAVAWFAMLSGGVILALNKFSILPRNAFTENATQYGSALEVMLLSFALADRLNFEKKERIEAQDIAHLQERNARIANESALHNERKAREAREHAFEIQKKATETLEQRVEERTCELNDILLQVRDANSHIMGSLRYARMIQLSMLPDPKKIREFLPGHFIWWVPRDLVGGDFYFIEKKEAWTVVAVADCTGHGVPGAFMTIIAGSELKRIVRGEACYDPGEILSRMNRRIRKTLKQDTSHALSDDGLDIGVCAFNNITGKLYFSGAKMTMYYTLGQELLTLPGDKNSVGYISSKEDYVYPVHDMDLHQNMTVYLFTDGITDQAGEENTLRFGTKRLLKLIKDNAHLSLDAQYECYKETLEKYKGSWEQRDDMTMVAFKPE